MSDIIDNAKYGCIIKFSYNPGISSSLKSFCKTYVRQENNSEDTGQYPIEEIFIQSESVNYKILNEDKEILNWLTEKNVEYIEI